jgi:hypothetical protein
MGPMMQFEILHWDRGVRWLVLRAAGRIFPLRNLSTSWRRT